MERDAGMRELMQSVSADAAPLADLPGRHHNADMAATWNTVTEQTGMSLHVAGPMRTAGPWEIEPIECDCVRIVAPRRRVVRNLLFAKEPT